MHSDFNRNSSFYNNLVSFFSAIPKFDTSAVSINCIASEPSYDPKKDVDNELCLSTSNTGDGAFSDITYLILTEAKDGAPPPNEECGTKYPDDYIYSNVLTATILLYHNGTH
ncbi:hypothetical protein C2G38_2238768 [Gigaspora rosea]|uniref:Uncharacterized protein n=1 Tax=Gigaspora rosea TaxID=44941 RepID=A0A397W5W7_9GLOM|nr:hypothetical protein C2G38_2238768 [Gigaspora rosea]